MSLQYAMSEDDIPPYILLVNTLTERGRKLSNWLRQPEMLRTAGLTDPIPERHVMSTNGSGEVAAIVSVMIAE